VSKRKRKAAKRQLPPRPVARPEQAGPAAPAVTAPISGQRGFNPDYSYIVKDLRRIGILAAGFITILVILSFFLG
jgi:hypothetical protein